MSALAFAFRYDDDGVDPAPMPARRLYAVRGTVDAPPAPDPAMPGPLTAAGGAPRLLASAAPPRLDVLIGGAWEALSGGTSSACPMCDAGTLMPRRTATAVIAGGRCGSCGTSVE